MGRRRNEDDYHPIDYSSQHDTYLNGRPIEGGADYNPYRQQTYLNGEPVNGDPDDEGGRGGFIKRLFGLGRVSDDQDEKYGDHSKDYKSRRKNAADALNDNEGMASSGGSSNTTGNGSVSEGAGGSDEARKAETGVPHGEADSFTSKVTGKKDGEKSSGKGSGFSKKALPVAGVGVGLVGFGALSFLGQLAMPISLVNQMIMNYDYASPMLAVRGMKMIKWALNPKIRNITQDADLFVSKHNKIYQKVTGSSEKYFDLTTKQISKLHNNGIEVVKMDGGDGYYLKYKASNGTDIEIVADPSEATGGRIVIDDAYEKMPDFQSKYDKGTRSWRDSANSWFDSVAKRYLDKAGVTRNAYENYDQNKSSAEQEADESLRTDSDEDGVRGRSSEAELEADDDGRVVDANGDEKPVELNLSKADSLEEMSKKLSDFSDGVAGKVSKIGQMAVSSVCTVANIIGSINVLVMATQKQTLMSRVSKIFESIQKAMIENNSSGSPLHFMTKMLVTPVSSTFIDSDGNEVITDKKSAMEAESISGTYTNTPIDANDISVSSFSLRGAIRQVMGSLGDVAVGFGSSMAAYGGCLIGKIAAGLTDSFFDAVESVSTLLSVFACIAGGIESFGAACGPLVSKTLFKLATQVAASIALATLIGIIVKYSVPAIMNILNREIADGGIVTGDAMSFIAHILHSFLYRSDGASLASSETYGIYLKEKNTYIANKARSERVYRSPFDISSPYTFMGSLIAKMVPVFSHTSSVLANASNILRVVGQSVFSLTPGASAVSAYTTAQAAVESTAENCPELDSIGAVGDAFCTPYVISDLDTIDMDPAQVTYEVYKYNNDNFSLTDNEDNPRINTDVKKSNLMKYILYCSRRNSTFGYADQNIANTINSGANTVENALPVVGGLLDVFQNADIAKNIGYVSGAACVTKNSGEGLGPSTMTWDEARLYQRYLEDQRIAENAGLINESAETVALKEYYSDHPIDDSYEGVLASNMGVTKEYLHDILDIMSGVLWVAGYDPSEFLPYKNIEEEQDNIEIADNNAFLHIESFINNDKKIVYIIKKEYLIS